MRPGPAKNEYLRIGGEPNRIVDRLSFGFPPDLAFTADTNQQKGRHEQPLKCPVVDQQHTQECARKERNTETEQDDLQSLFHLGSMPGN